MEPASLRTLYSRGHHLAGTTQLKQETAVQYILSDIPFFAVGIFVFGASTSLFILKRINWFVASLHAAVVLAFAGAVLDLIQLLARGKHSTAAVQNVNPFLALIIAREVTYALSFGLRFVFYWGFVGSPPMGSKDKDAYDLHSGSWGRWGVTGLVLQWALVVATLAITAIQVAFRVYTPLQSLNAVQDTEGALEACVSAVLILKLFLNVYLAALDSYGAIRRLHLFLRYLPVIVALVISAAIGVGNVIELLFSETVLGRFLQGVELYILVLYMLVDAFRPESTKSPRRRDRSSSFHNMPPGIPRASDFLLGPPRVPEPKFNPMFTEEMPFTEPPKPSQAWEPSLAGYSLRVSNWFGRRPSKKSTTARATRDFDGVWIQDQAERGMSPVAEVVETPLPEKSFDSIATEPKQSPVAKEPVYATIVISDPVDPVEVASPRAAAITVPPRVYSREFDKQYLYPTTPNSPSQTDSPIHGLYGVVNAKRPPSVSTTRSMTPDEDPRDVFDRSARSSGISGLLRQQEELDKSIAALKLLSGAGDESRRTSSTGTATPNRFSLSVFPEPPWGRASIASAARPVLGSLAIASAQRSRASSPDRPRQQSIPLSELAAGDSDFLLPFRRNIRTASAGTQYEITSFIGHLTHPGHSLQNSISTQASLAVSSGDGAAKTETTLTTIPESIQATASATGTSERPKISVQIPPQPAAESGAVPSALESSLSKAATPALATVTPRTLTVGGRVRPVGLPSGPRLYTSTSPPSAQPARDSSFTPTPF